VGVLQKCRLTRGHLQKYRLTMGFLCTG
jgi:hypothetical protein